MRVRYPDTTEVNYIIDYANTVIRIAGVIIISSVCNLLKYFEAAMSQTVKYLIFRKHCFYSKVRGIEY